MPASVDPKKDRTIFLKILTMDDEGTVPYTRKDKLDDQLAPRAQPARS